MVHSVMKAFICTFTCKDTWQEVIDDCLQHIEPEIQNSAVEAIPAFFTEYYRNNDGSAIQEFQGKYRICRIHGIHFDFAD